MFSCLGMEKGEGRLLYVYVCVDDQGKFELLLAMNCVLFSCYCSSPAKKGAVARKSTKASKKHSTPQSSKFKSAEFVESDDESSGAEESELVACVRSCSLRQIVKLHSIWHL